MPIPAGACFQNRPACMRAAVARMYQSEPVYHLITNTAPQPGWSGFCGAGAREKADRRFQDELDTHHKSAPVKTAKKLAGEPTTSVYDRVHGQPKQVKKAASAGGSVKAEKPAGHDARKTPAPKPASKSAAKVVKTKAIKKPIMPPRTLLASILEQIGA